MYNINEITIVGGGTAGWMSAAYLSKQLKKYNTNISIILPDNSNPIGVGESTIIEFKDFLKVMDLKDEEWMPYCKATYKSSIDFKGWDGSDFTSKFLFEYIKNKDEIKYYNEALNHGVTREEFHNFVFEGYQSAKLNKISEKYTKLYHLKANLFTELLKDKFCGSVTIHNDTITDFKTNKYGDITELIGNKNYKSDLYVDCTGFQSLILGNFMSSPYTEIEELINDKAITAYIPYHNKETEMLSATTSTAMKNGWSWNIPLWDEISVGYVYSSKFCTTEEAKQELREFIGHNIEFKEINIKNGYYQPMNRNVIGIGLSASFIEPLASTGLVLAYQGLDYLVNLLTIRKRSTLMFSSMDIKMYNKSFLKKYNEWLDFVLLMFLRAEKSDTDYWNYLSNEIQTDRDFHYRFPEGLTPFDGGGEIVKKQYNKKKLAELINKTNKRTELKKSEAKDMLNHYDYLKKYIYKEIK